MSGNLTRKVFVLCAGPAPARLYGENLARNDTPQSCGAQGDRLGGLENPAARGRLFQAPDDEIQRCGFGKQIVSPDKSELMR